MRRVTISIKTSTLIALVRKHLVQVEPGKYGDRCNDALQKLQGHEFLATHISGGCDEITIHGVTDEPQNPLYEFTENYSIWCDAQVGL